jgi:hypothetical protein
MTYRIGKWLLLFGVLITAIGLVAGFYFLFSEQDERAKLFLGTVPPGFLMVFTGLVMTLLAETRE